MAAWMGNGRGRAAAIGAGAIAFAALAATTALPALVEWRAGIALRAAGFAEAAVQIDRIGPSGLEAAVRLPGNQGIDRLAVEWSLGDLAAGRVRRVLLEGLRLEMAPGSGVIWPLGFTPPAASSGTTAPFDPPFAALEVERGQMTINSPLGPLHLPATGSLRRTDDGALMFDAAVVVGPAGPRIALAGTRDATGRLTGRLTPVPDDGISGASLQGALDFTAAPGGPVEGEGTLRLQPSAADGIGAATADIVWRGVAGAQGLHVAAALPGGSLDLIAAYEPGDGQSQAALDARLRVEDAARAVAAIGLTVPVQGRGTVAATYSGPPGDESTPVAFEFAVDRVAWPGLFTQGRIDGTAVLERTADGFALRTGETLRIEGVPDPVLKRTAGPLLGDGPIALRLSAPSRNEPGSVVLTAKGGVHSVAITGQVDLRAGGATLSGRVATARASFAKDGMGGALLDVADGALTLAAPVPVALHGLAFRVEHEPGRAVPLTLTLRSDAARIGPGPGWVAPMALEATAEGNPAGVLTAKAAGQAADGALVIDATATHDRATGAGDGSVILHPVTFLEGARAPAALFPILEGLVESGSGRFGVRLRPAWGLGVGPGRGDLLMEDLSLVGPWGAARGLNGVVVANGLSPLTTPEDQLIAIGLLNIGVPLSDGLLRFRIDEAMRLRVDDARFAWAGGTVRAAPFALSLLRPEGTVDLVAANLDLAKVLELAGVEGLAATGTLEGRIPVVFNDNVVGFKNGRLGAVSEGSLRYDPAVPPTFLDPTRNDNMAMVGQVLQDFRYKDLTVTIDGTVGGEMAVALRLNGANPSFYGGYPVALNLNLSGALDTILRSGLGSYRIPDEVRARIERQGKTAP